MLCAVWGAPKEGHQSSDTDSAEAAQSLRVRAPGLCGGADRSGHGQPAGGMAEPAKQASSTVELTPLPRCAQGRWETKGTC